MFDLTLDTFFNDRE